MIKCDKNLKPAIVTCESKESVWLELLTKIKEDEENYNYIHTIPFYTEYGYISKRFIEYKKNINEARQH